jgi:hypothetical protein
LCLSLRNGTISWHLLRQREEWNKLDTPEKRTTPPYLSFTTLNTFIEGLAVHMPTRIDKSLMKSMSGASQSALIAALDYFGLRDGEKPSEAMVALAVSTGTERAATWKRLITAKYPFLFSDGFDLKRATQGELDEKFRDEGVTGETIRKCVAFFMAAATAAGLEVSPRFRSIKTRSPRSRSASTTTRSKKTKREDKSKASSDEDADVDRDKGKQTNLPPVIQAWIDEMPPAGGEWSREDFDSWLALFSGSIERLYKIPKKA